ncbi:MAG: DUF4190 domain-containing protein [Lachnospiraceae bacterium]|nr:DUF4190 domain-containing protein [Lachnospiraceae bacterium]
MDENNYNSTNDENVERVEGTVEGTYSSSENGSYHEGGNGTNGGNNDGNEPGKGQATASLVLGIISIVFWFFGMGALVGLVTGIIGILCSSNAKKAGYTGSMAKAGFICSLIGTIGSALVFVACVACVGMLGIAGASSALAY